MSATRAPKQWCLTKRETITSFESWRQNLEYTLSLDKNFAPFLIGGVTWLKKTPTQPLRGFTDDPDETPEAAKRTAQQKVTHLELMLGQIANFCPVISRNTIVKASTSINCIWQAIRLHFGFQTSGANFLDFNDIKLEPEERPEDLFQRLTSFVEDNLLKTESQIRHHDEAPTADEELTPSLENMIVLTWLRLIHPSLPTLVKQRYGTELRSKTIASIKPEISQALDSLLDEVHSLQDSKVLRTALEHAKFSSTKPKAKMTGPICPLCKQAGRPRYQHFLSACRYLPESDKRFMSKVRQASEDQNDDTIDDDEDKSYDSHSMLRVTPTTRRVHAKQSPVMKVFFGHHTSSITIDSGAELNIIKHSVAKSMGIPIKPSTQSALQADGVTPLPTTGEVHIQFTRGELSLAFDALVVEKFDVDVLGGIPFMEANDVSIRPAKHEIVIAGHETVRYGPLNKRISDNESSVHTRPYVLRVSSATSVVWPGEFIEVCLPPTADPDSVIALEPRSDCSSTKGTWPEPQIIEAVNGRVRILNDSDQPQKLGKHDHFCQALPAIIAPTKMTTTTSEPHRKPVTAGSDPTNTPYSDTIVLDPDNVMSAQQRRDFSTLHREHDQVFSPDISGYNGFAGPFEAKVNMGPVQPPQRKGRVPQYNRDKLVQLQDKFDELEEKGVFSRPEDIGVSVEYLNPSFLVKKSQGGFRLVTAFTDVGRYSKPQPSLMPDVDSTLRTIASWKHIIVSDLTSAFYQIPLSKDSMKYCGVATPFKGVRVYTRTAMGMPGSETALEELMCRVLGDCVQDGIVAKLADDLYCGGNSLAELYSNWKRVLEQLHNANLKLSPSKTIVDPTRTTILGWIWSQGRLSASPHKLGVLSTCPPPPTVHGLRSFIGAYKVLARVVPNTSRLLAPLDNVVAGRASNEKIEWSEAIQAHFANAQKSLNNHKSILLPRPSDRIWIVTDGSVVQRGIGATMYVSRNDKLHLAGFFSAKLRKHQVTWLPCEIEALSIAAAVKHFSPYIIQSKENACVLTDSQPCVQAIEKLCRGEFSASPRVTSFLSTVSRYNVSVRHLAGSANLPSDFASRNAPECNEPHCQVCKFVVETEDSVVRAVCMSDVISGVSRLPFTTRSAWKDIQSECPDLRRAHAHLKQGTRPSKKLTNIHDVKRYLNVATIAKDNLMVVKRNDPLLPSVELIVVPRAVVDGLVTALHTKLDHPSRHQMKQVLNRQFYALDISQAVERVHKSCHVCASLQVFPDSIVSQSSEDPPEAIGIAYAVDVLKRNKQLVMVLRESASSFTKTCFIENERHETLRSALLRLVIDMHPLDGPPAVVRCDGAPGFLTLKDDETLRKYRVMLEIGRVKNVNKNPVAEKAIAELEGELLRQEPGGGPVTELGLAVATARLNSRIRQAGLSSREIWTHRNQFSNEQMPLSEREVILKKHTERLTNHPHSEKSKHHSGAHRSPDKISVGDLVYLICDKDKHKCRDRYLVVSMDNANDWCFIKKFSGNQLRATSYKVKVSECYRVPCQISMSDPINSMQDNDSDDETIFPTRQEPPPLASVPPILTRPASGVELPPPHNEHLDMDNLTVVSGEYDIDIDQDDVMEEIRTDMSASAQVVDIQPSGRPQRICKPPKYLDDYLRD